MMTSAVKYMLTKNYAYLPYTVIIYEICSVTGILKIFFYMVTLYQVSRFSFGNKLYK